MTKKAVSPNQESYTPQPKNTTFSKDLLVGLLALFLYCTVKMNGLIVAIGLVAYFFYGKSDNREIPSKLKRKIVIDLCAWHCGCSGPETVRYCYCKENVVIE